MCGKVVCSFPQRQFLEERGLSCWMDIGQMGGGERLYQRIYQGVAGCRVVLCCLSPKFLVSDWCVKEILLADLLKKAVIPVMVAAIPWPPPGPLESSYSRFDPFLPDSLLAGSRHVSHTTC